MDSNMLDDWLGHAEEYGKDAQGLWVASTYYELAEANKGAEGKLGGWVKRERMNGLDWVSPNGASLRFAVIKDGEDADAFMGQEYTFLDLANLTNNTLINKLKATLRSSNPSITPQFN